MNELKTWERHNSIEHNIPVSQDFGQVANQICEKALNDAKRQLHPLLRNIELARLERRNDFLQAFKSALEQRIAGKLADWQPGVLAIFQFDETWIRDLDCWDGSIHLLVKVSNLSNSVKPIERMLDCNLMTYLRQLGWRRFRTRRTILEIQQVTLNELRHATGYGAMFCAVYTVPVKVWPRDWRDR